MCKHIRVFPSLKKEENIIVLEDLQRLKKAKNITFEFLGSVGILDEFINLPAIITDQGDRVDGLEPVKRFLKGQLKRDLALKR